MTSVPKTHPYLWGSREDLVALARERPGDYRRVADAAQRADVSEFPKALSLGLVHAIDGDQRSGRQAVELALAKIRAPILVGHVPFGEAMACCVAAFDLCREYWSEDDCAALFDYINRTCQANLTEEDHVFHNSYWGSKIAGFGLAAYATYHENPNAAGILAYVDNDLRTRGLPGLRRAGDGGGWAEGYYIHYFLQTTLEFFELARRMDNTDYYAMAPGFFRNRAVASMFEMYPGLRERSVREPAPMQDYGTRRYKPHRDRVAPSMRILARYFKDDPANQAAFAFAQATPKTIEPAYAYMDLLEPRGEVPAVDLAAFRLSHHSPGAGHVQARSSWADDATYFYFRCGDRFTSHQHLDVGHFLIFKHEELAGDGGHFSDWNGIHDVNYYIRTIAHSTVLVHDPAETWSGIRKTDLHELGNDGGQAFPWAHIHHNGGVADIAQWDRHADALKTGEMLAYEDHGAHLYVAGDCSRAYARTKVDHFTRQIVFIRPGTFVIVDRVQATSAAFRKTWVLQAMRVPERRGEHLVITHGQGRLFVQTLSPVEVDVRLFHGDELYSYGGTSYAPATLTGPAPECRVEISPRRSAEADVFIHVLTATEASVETVPIGRVTIVGAEMSIEVGAARVRVRSDRVECVVDASAPRP